MSQHCPPGFKVQPHSHLTAPLLGGYYDYLYFTDGKTGTQRLRPCPRSHSYETMELALELGQSGYKTCALNHSTILPWIQQKAYCTSSQRGREEALKSTSNVEWIFPRGASGEITLWDVRKIVLKILLSPNLTTLAAVPLKSPSSDSFLNFLQNL